ncbi:MAG TPA: NAD(P)-dependent oxidoreductase [Solirubrobacteraceae bacterium]|nr:NAD(P)-dependent oxidoreductase [Solirubrobacteraceae bacterium]
MIAAITARAVEAVRAAAPSGVDVRALPDGHEEAEFLVISDDPEALQALPGLRSARVVQTVSAGTDWIEDRVPPWATLCNARGARDTAVAEWVVGALLAAQHGLLRAAHARTWAGERGAAGAATGSTDWIADLEGLTVLIVGHGSIGRAVERRLEPFGVHVVGVAGRARGGVHGIDELPALLPGADVLVVLAPLTAATRGLIGADELAALPDGALVANAGRGPVVITDALVAELERGRLRAALDVTDPEPLPAGHPLWDLALAITPHDAGDTPDADRRAFVLAGEQLARHARGEPLRNVVRAASR